MKKALISLVMLMVVGCGEECRDCGSTTTTIKPPPPTSTPCPIPPTPTPKPPTPTPCPPTPTPTPKPSPTPCPPVPTPTPKPSPTPCPPPKCEYTKIKVCKKIHLSCHSHGCKKHKCNVKHYKESCVYLPGPKVCK